MNVNLCFYTVLLWSLPLKLVSLGVIYPNAGQACPGSHTTAFVTDKWVDGVEM